MILNKKTIFLIIIFFLFTNFSYSKIDLQIIMKINNQIVTSYDIEKESNYLLALNPKLNEINKKDLLELAKKSMIKEMIRKSEILKYKEINLDNPRNQNILRNIMLNLDFSNQQLDFVSQQLDFFNQTLDLFSQK